MVNCSMKKRISIIIGMILLTILACVSVKSSIRPVYLDEELKNDLLFHMSTYEGFPMNNDINQRDISMYQNELHTYQELFDQADAIVMVSFLSHEQEGFVFNTKVKVERVYKGTTEKEIYVYEPVFVRIHMTKDIHTESCYLPMIEEKQYVLFLKEEKDIKIRPQYNLLSSFYGKFSVTSQLDIGFIHNQNDDNYYDDFKEKDFLKVDISETKQYLENETDELNRDIDLKRIELYEEYRDHGYEDAWNQVKILWENEEGTTS